LEVEHVARALLFGVEPKAKRKQTRDLQNPVTKHEGKKVWWVH
jgi:hypothetical protein